MSAPPSGPPPGWVDEPIRIEPPRPDWPARFEAERQALEAAIGPWATGGIHHVGSTAVPGLDAKPVIDILVGVDDLESSRACFGLLAQLGYLHAPYLPDEMHWFCKPDPARRTHHLHLVPAGSQRFADELAFRDHLRGMPGAAAEYAALKRRLAGEHPDDREAYTAAKAAFVTDALSWRTVLRSLDRWTEAQARGNPESFVLRRPGVTAGVTPAAPTIPILNGVTFTDASALARWRDDLAAAYRAAAVRSWSVWVPESERATARLLAGAGHQLLAEPVAMIAQLGGVPPLPGESGGVYCRDAPDCWQVADLIDRAQGLPAGSFEVAILGMQAHFTLAEAGGDPVAGCVLVEGDGDAHIGLVAAPREPQGHGDACAVLRHALAGAVQRGCRTATTRAAGALVPAAELLGFRRLGAIASWELRR